MPEKDTVVSLYVGGTDEGEAIVINSLRKDKRKDIDGPEMRYLTSIDKKRMLIIKKEIGVWNKQANVHVKKKINIEGKTVHLGYGATALENGEKADKLNTSKIMPPEKYESEIESMSQEIMEGYFRKDGGKLSLAVTGKNDDYGHEMTDVSQRKNNLPLESGKVISGEPSIYYDARKVYYEGQCSRN